MTQEIMSTEFLSFRNDLEMSVEDQRKGMGIGGYHMRYTIKHKPTNCEISYETHGAEPASQHTMKERAIMALELLTEAYYLPRNRI